MTSFNDYKDNKTFTPIESYGKSDEGMWVACEAIWRHKATGRITEYIDYLNNKLNTSYKIVEDYDYYDEVAKRMYHFFQTNIPNEYLS